MKFASAATSYVDICNTVLLVQHHQVVAIYDESANYVDIHSIETAVANAMALAPQAVKVYTRDVFGSDL